MQFHDGRKTGSVASVWRRQAEVKWRRKRRAERARVGTKHRAAERQTEALGRCPSATSARGAQPRGRKEHGEAEQALVVAGTSNQNQFPLYHEEISPSGSNGARTVRLKPRSQCTRTHWCFFKWRISYGLILC